MASKVKIGGKEYSCSKEVAEHISWLEIQVKVCSEQVDTAREILDKFQMEVNTQFEVVGSFIKQIKPL